jgi:tetratricopeptide (TPR) repeat protein/S1-C subfamily serine protease
MRRLLPLAILLLTTLSLAGAFLVPPSAPTQDPTPGVGWVLARDVGKGTGWILDARKRWLVTCWHVVGDNPTVEVVFPCTVEGQFEPRRSWYLEHMPRLREEKRVVKGRVLHRETAVDLALVELESLPEGVVALPVAAESPEPGDRVHGVGNRYDVDLLWVRSRGWVRQVRKLKDGYFTGGKQVSRGAWIVEARVPINEGDSGGPLLDTRGQVVGTAAAVAWESEGAGYFIDVRELRSFLARAGKVTPPGQQPTPAPAPSEPAPRDLYQRLLPSAVLVLPTETKRRGGGWIVDRDRRLVLTGAELVGTRKAATVRFPVGRPATGVVLARDERRNLALLELDTLPPEAVAGRFADAEPLPGDTLHGITHAARPELDWLYLGTSLRQVGPVKLQREDSDPPRTLLLQAMPSEGEEGSPIADNEGRIVGQHAGKGPPQQQIAYALSAGEIKAFLREQSARWQPRTEFDYLARAKLFREGKAEEMALRDLGRALDVNPSSATACSERASLYQQLGKLDDALADADRAVKLDPRLPAAWARRAEARAGRDDLPGALADADRAVTLNRESADVQRVRALVLRRLGRFPEALACADEAVWLDRKSSSAYRERGWIHLDRDDPLKAIDDLDFALRLDEDDALAYRLRGEAKLARSDVRAALTDFDAALRRAPGDARAWLGHGRASGDTADFTRALARDPNLAGAYLERGDARLRGASLVAGFDDLTEAVRLQPSLRPAALARVRRLVRVLEPTDPTMAGRLALGAVARLLPAKEDRVWRELDPDPARRIEGLRALLE